MKRRKDPPGYPGDEAINKELGERLRKLRLNKGWSIDETNEIVKEALRHDPYPSLPRVVGILVRQLREERKMSRVQLSSVSGLSVRFIGNVERGKVADLSVTDIVRLAMGLNHPVDDFIAQIEKSVTSHKQ